MAFVDTAEQAAVETIKQMARRWRSAEEKRRIVRETLVWIIREVEKKAKAPIVIERLYHKNFSSLKRLLLGRRLTASALVGAALVREVRAYTPTLDPKI